jgi:glucokinase
MAAPVVLGLDFGGTKMAAAVVDTTGVRLADVITEVRPSDGAEQTFGLGIAAAHRLLADLEAEDLLAAVGACTFGIPHEDRVELAPTIAGWEQLAFGRRLRDAFPGVPVRTATDVKAAARAELDDGALTGCDVGLYVNLGTGFAVAMVVGGSVVEGQHGAAGEIGYNLRHPGAALDALRAEGVVSGQALRVAAHRLLGRPDVPRLFAGAGADPAAREVVGQFLDELCFHLVNLVIALDPQRVVVGGGLVRSWDRFGATVAAALDAGVPFPPELVLAARPYDAPLLGALALARSAVPDLSPVADALSEGAPA